MDKTNKQLTSFWNLIRNHKIIIPIIQRDYAQGRPNEAPLRKRFLPSLKKALDGSIDVSDDKRNSHRLILDFVYCTPSSYGAVAPLDGQQRLTTLWLLHWYLAYVTGAMTDSVRNTLKSFSYETRVSSRDFCNKLCDLVPLEDGCCSIKKHIENQTWFYSVWRQDPTVCAMLTMLFGNEKQKDDDNISAIFDRKDKELLKKYWEALTTAEQAEAPIMFNHTIIGSEELPLSDDLYIKMNARGKPLSNFENFKAEVIKWLSDNDAKEKAVEYASKFDNEWTDIFWDKGLGKQVHNVDELFFAFINRLNYQYIVTDRENGTFLLKDKNSEADYFSGVDNKHDKLVSFQSLELYTSRLIKTLEDLDIIFENIKTIDPESFQPYWDKSFFFIPQYLFNKDNSPKKLTEEILDFTTINQMQRVAFYAICKYLLHLSSEDDDTDSLSHWMRFVWNLISNKDSEGKDTIRSVATIQEAVALIDLIQNPRRVYGELFERSGELLNLLKKDSRLKLRFIEEIEKINQIINPDPSIMVPSGFDSWEQAIIEAERFRFFNGAIGVLFHNDEGAVDWADFETKFANARNYFSQPDYQGVISHMIPFLSDQDILRVFSENSLQYKDANVCFILRTCQSSFHKYLMGEKRSDTLTRLQSDIITLCEDNPGFWIHPNWVCGKHVLSNFSYRSGGYESNSYFIDTDCIEERYRFLEAAQSESADMDFTIPREYTNPYKGLYVDFLCYYRDYREKKYKFRWTGADWVDMYDKDINLWREGLHSNYNDTNQVHPHFQDVPSFLAEIKRCITSFIQMQDGATGLGTDSIIP